VTSKELGIAQFKAFSHNLAYLNCLYSHLWRFSPA